MAPDTAVLQIHGFGQIRSQRQHSIVRDVVQPLYDLGNSAARACDLAVLAEQRDLHLFLRP